MADGHGRPTGRAPAREVVAEHRDLEARFRAVRGALAEGRTAAARAGLARLEEALAAHFEHESRLYYPSIGALRPHLRGALGALVDAHPELLRGVAAIRAELDEGSPLRSAALFDAFVRTFGEHERAEEDLLRGLETAAEAAPLRES